MPPESGRESPAPGLGEGEHGLAGLDLQSWAEIVCGNFRVDR